MANGRDVNTSIMYFRSTGTHAAGAGAVQYTHFAGQQPGTAGFAVNDLGFQGFLPYNADGKITGVFFKTDILETANTTLENTIIGLVDSARVLNQATLTLRIGDTSVVETAPVYFFPAPPLIISGVTADAATDNQTFAAIQNGGWSPFWINQPVPPRTRIQVVIDSDPVTAVSAATVTYQVILQVAVNRPVHVGG